MISKADSATPERAGNRRRVIFKRMLAIRWTKSIFSGRQRHSTSLDHAHQHKISRGDGTLKSHEQEAVSSFLAETDFFDEANSFTVTEDEAFKVTLPFETASLDLQSYCDRVLFTESLFES